MHRPLRTVSASATKRDLLAVFGKMSSTDKRERQRGTEAERHRGTEAERQRDRETGRETKREGQTGTEAEGQRDSAGAPRVQMLGGLAAVCIGRWPARRSTCCSAVDHALRAAVAQQR